MDTNKTGTNQPEGTCPNCGYCQHCGRMNHPFTYPYVWQSSPFAPSSYITDNNTSHSPD